MIRGARQQYVDWIDARYEKVPLKKLDRIAQAIAGIFFTLFALMFTALPFLTWAEAADSAGRIFSVLAAIAAVLLDTYVIRYTYQGFKGYKLVKITTEAQVKQASVAQLAYLEKKNQQQKEWIDAFFNNTIVRYLIAALFLYIGYSLAFESHVKNGWILGLCSLVMAGIFAAELSIFILVISGIGLAGWALYAGMVALPTSAAIIIGALILAGALGGRR